MLTTSAFTDIITERLMSVAKLFFAKSNVPFVLPATKLAGVLSRNAANVWINLLIVCNGRDKAIHKCTIAHKYGDDARFTQLNTKDPSSLSEAS